MKKVKLNKVKRNVYRKPKYKCVYQDSGWCHKWNDDCWHQVRPEECSESVLVEIEREHEPTEMDR